MKEFSSINNVSAFYGKNFNGMTARRVLGRVIDAFTAVHIEKGKR
jgi:hypothetical protein